jgi:hypothetical protein
MSVGLRRRGLANLALLCASLVFAAFTGEAFLRLIGYNYPAFYQYDFDVGVRHRPGAMGWFRKEAEVFIAFNHQGIRVPMDRVDEIVSITKPESVVRIAVLGDSFTEGLQVTARERFTHVLENGLNKCNAFPDRTVEVINFGVSGMGQSREMALYESFVKFFSPDVVLVAIAGNDFFNNVRELTKDPFSPYWEIDSTGNLVWDRRFQTNPIFLRKLRWSVLRQNVSSYSRLLQLFTQTYVVLAVNDGGPHTWKDNATDRRGTHPALFVSPPNSERERHAWNIFVAGMRAWSHDVRQDGGIFAATSIPSHYVMRSDTWHTYRDSFGLPHELLMPEYIDTALSTIAQEENFTYFPVINSIRDRAYRGTHDLYYHAYSGVNWGHMNALGHRFVGDELAKQMCADFKK